MIRRLFLAFVVLFITASIRATCLNIEALPDKEFKKHVTQGPVIFGTVTAIQPATAGSPELLTIAIDRKWTSDVPDELTVAYFGESGTFESELGGVGTKRLFLSFYHTRWKMLAVGFCGSGTSDSVLAARVISVLGPGTELPRPKGPPMKTDSDWSGFPLFISAVLVIVGVTVAGLLIFFMQRTGDKKVQSISESDPREDGDA